MGSFLGGASSLDSGLSGIVLFSVSRGFLVLRLASPEALVPVVFFSGFSFPSELVLGVFSSSSSGLGSGFSLGFSVFGFEESSLGFSSVSGFGALGFLG